jgi:hypothetical protein
MERAAASGLSADELQAAQAGFGVRRQALLQSHSLHAVEYAKALFNLQPASSVDDLHDRASKIAPDEIKRVSANYFKKSSMRAAIIQGSAPAQKETPKIN